MNIRELIEKSVERNADKIYLYFIPNKQQFTYREFNDNINRTGNKLLQLGLKKGDKVCLMLPNSPEFLFSWFGINKIGAIMVPINTAFKSRETKYILDHSEANTFIASSQYLETVREIEHECPHLKNMIYLGSEDIPGVQPFSKLIMNCSANLPEVEISMEDVATYIYTSGTTGPPKAVMLPHRTYVYCGQGFNYWMALRPEDNCMTSLPLFHANAQVYSVMGTLDRGCSLVLADKFSASKLWDWVRNYNVTQFNYIGAMPRYIFNQPKKPDDDDNPVRIAFGGPTPKEKFREFEERFGLTILGGFTLSETPMGCIDRINGRRNPAALGKPMRHPNPELKTEVKVVDSKTGTELSPNTVGEIWIKSPAMMVGYFKDPAKTAETMAGGTIHTGDLGYKDEDGFFWFVDRAKDIIRRRGENISSVEVEQAINEHPKVLESAVVAVPYEFGEDEVKACIVLKPGETLPPEELYDWCENGWPTSNYPDISSITKPYQRPRHKG